MTTPLCSVVIPTFNRSRLLRSSLESLARQNLPSGSVEVFVVDDGSTDDTAEVTASFRGLPRLTYLAQEDLGYRVATARNLGLRHVTAPVTVFLDSGVLLHSRALEAHISSHRSGRQPVAVCGYVYGFNENNEDGAEIERALNYENPDSTMTEMAAHGKWLDIREEFYEKYSDEFAGLPAPWLIWWTCNVSARTEQLRSVGGFDENYRGWGGEDVDLAYRLHRSGARFVLNRAAAGIHAPHPKSFRENLRSITNNYRYFTEKFDTPITRLVTPDVSFFRINDMIRDRSLPSCEDYLASRDSQEPSALVFSAWPDDAVIACGGVMARKTGMGADVDVAFVTSGTTTGDALGPDRPRPHFFGLPHDWPSTARAKFRGAALQLLADHREVEEIYIPHDVREVDSCRRLAGQIVLECLETLGITARVYKYAIGCHLTEADPGPLLHAVAKDQRTALGADERLVARDITPHFAAKRVALGPHREQACPRGMEEFWTTTAKESDEGHVPMSC